MFALLHVGRKYSTEEDEGMYSCEVSSNTHSLLPRMARVSLAKWYIYSHVCRENVSYWFHFQYCNAQSQTVAHLISFVLVLTSVHWLHVCQMVWLHFSHLRCFVCKTIGFYKLNCPAIARCLPWFISCMYCDKKHRLPVPHQEVPLYHVSSKCKKTLTQSTLFS